MVAYEDVVVPAGSWKAFRIESQSGGSSFSTLWYAPEIQLVVREVLETTMEHPFGRTKSIYEIVRYSDPAKPLTASAGKKSHRVF